MSDRMFIHYADDGPRGACGQTMSTTSPWSRLYVYEGPDAESDGEAFIRFVRRPGAASALGRRGPRIEAWWTEADGQVHEGPILPPSHRC